jgi:glycosyltransferase involved in cell wall biosynthesis
MQMEYTFSIIIPHFDIPDLLMRCLKSIPVSEDIQVIVVDDNSPDADTYLERYPELSRPYLEFIRTTKGGGAGYARNIGLDHAKGEWLLFADADDFYVEDMYDIISSNADSEADVIYFKKESVYSENIIQKTDRDVYIDRMINNYYANGDEWPLRFMYCPTWGKMIKRDLINKFNIRFEEIRYSNDAFFSLFVGYHAETIEVVNKVLYVLTSRPDSLAANYCSKPNELRIRAEVHYRSDLFLHQHQMCKERSMKKYLLLMFNNDRKLFKYYFFKLDEIYPSKLSALRDFCKNKPLRFKIKFYLYSFLVWTRIL